MTSVQIVANRERAFVVSGAVISGQAIVIPEEYIRLRQDTPTTKSQAKPEYFPVFAAVAFVSSIMVIPFDFFVGSLIGVPAFAYLMAYAKERHGWKAP